MSIETIPDNILKRIQKLLSLAEGAKQIGSMAEAANAAQKAQDLLLEYNLSHDEVLNASTKEERVVGQQKVDYEGMIQGKEGDWVRDLYFVIGKNNLCKIILIQNKWTKQKLICIIGESHNVEIVKYFVEYLVPQIRQLARQSWSKYYGEDKRGAYIRGFLLGCVKGIDDQLSGHIKAMAAQNEKINALVRVSDLNIQKYVAANFGRLGTVKSASRSAQDGIKDGREAGRNISLHKGVNGGGNAFNKGLLN